LQDYNVLVLKRGAENFLEAHLKVKLIYKPTQLKNLNYKVIQNQYTNTLVKENIIQLTPCVFKMAFKMPKNNNKKLQRTHLWLNLPLLKCFLVTHNLLD